MRSVSKWVVQSWNWRRRNLYCSCRWSEERNSSQVLTSDDALTNSQHIVRNSVSWKRYATRRIFSSITTKRHNSNSTICITTVANHVKYLNPHDLICCVFASSLCRVVVGGNIITMMFVHVFSWTIFPQRHWWCGNEENKCNNQSIQYITEELRVGGSRGIINKNCYTRHCYPRAHIDCATNKGKLWLCRCNPSK